MKQNRTLYAQANSNLPIRIQTVEQRAAGCYYNRQQTRSSLAADSSICLFSTSSNTVSNPWHSLRYVGKPRLDEKTYNCMMYIAFPCFITGVASANSCSHLHRKNKLGAKTLCGKGGLSQAKDDRSWDSS
jgi:hypothetical protein